MDISQLEVQLKLNRDDVNTVIDSMVELIAQLGEVSYQGEQVKQAADTMIGKAQALITKFESVRFEVSADPPKHSDPVCAVCGVQIPQPPGPASFPPFYCLKHRDQMPRTQYA